MMAGVHAQGHQGEILLVIMVPEIKHARESGAGIELLIPTAVRQLRVQQIGEALLNLSRANLTRAHQAHQRPRRLRGGTGADPFVLRVIVAAERLAPAAIRILVILQPRHRPTRVGLAQIGTNGLQAAQHLPGAIDVVGAPPAKPGAVGTLVAAEESERFLHALVLDRKSEMTETLERPGRDVGRARVNHRVMVGKGHLRKEPLVVVFVK